MMSDGPDRKSHTMTWTVSVLAVLLLLYVATWPPIELKMTWYITTNVEVDSAVQFKRVRPEWVEILYQPLHYLASLNQGANVVSMYYDCWAKRPP